MNSEVVLSALQRIVHAMTHVVKRVVVRRGKRLVRIVSGRFVQANRAIQRYITKLLFPIYLFPVKLFTYSLYYFIRFIIRLMVAAIGLMIDTITYPFVSMKHFLKSLGVLLVSCYLCLTFVVIADYIDRQYGTFEKMLCGLGYPVNEKIQNSVVRIVGGYSEGSGFFIEDSKVMTNFHVIADEPSPKIILPSGKFITPVRIVGDPDADLAILYVDGTYPNLVMPLPYNDRLREDETLIAGGYAMGTDLAGSPTILKGRFIEYRISQSAPAMFIQSDMSLVSGMSGGPLLDQCGEVIGINTRGVAGLSLFISADWARSIMDDFSDQAITKISVDPAQSPEEAVLAFYTYLKARRMEDGFALLSQEYLKKTNFEEWTSRFSDVIDVDVIVSEPFEESDNTVFVKFTTKNWVNGYVEPHYYEGTWQMVFEGGVYKIAQGNIKEVYNPGWEWFF